MKEVQIMQRTDITKACFVLLLLALMLGFYPRQATGQNPWGILSGFHSVGVGRFDGAVVSVLFNADDSLMALVVFPALCDGDDCVLSDPAAFFVGDLDGGVVRLHIEPGREAICQPIFASVLKGFALA
jgi:hypothetical protein